MLQPMTLINACACCASGRVTRVNTCQKFLVLFLLFLDYRWGGYFQCPFGSPVLDHLTYSNSTKKWIDTISDASASASLDWSRCESLNLIELWAVLTGWGIGCGLGCSELASKSSWGRSNVSIGRRALKNFVHLIAFCEALQCERHTHASMVCKQLSHDININDMSLHV